MTMRQKGEVMQMMIRHGITDLNEIRNTWNHKFGMGGLPNDGYMPSGIECPIYGYGGHLYDGRNPNGQRMYVNNAQGNGPLLNQQSYANATLFNNVYDLNELANTYITDAKQHVDNWVQIAENGQRKQLNKTNRSNGRKRNNDTEGTTESGIEKKELAQRVEDMMRRDLKIKYPNASQTIPYIDSLEIHVPGIGRVSTNALDTLAKYAAITSTPLYQALGLSAQETNFGAAPYFNMASPEYPNRNLLYHDGIRNCFEL